MKQAIAVCVDTTQYPVLGEVREDFATFGGDAVENQQDSIGCINLFGLPITVRSSLMGG